MPWRHAWSTISAKTILQHKVNLIRSNNTRHDSITDNNKETAQRYLINDDNHSSSIVSHTHLHRILKKQTSFMLNNFNKKPAASWFVVTFAFKLLALTTAESNSKTHRGEPDAYQSREMKVWETAAVPCNKYIATPSSGDDELPHQCWADKGESRNYNRSGRLGEKWNKEVMNTNMK